MKKLPLFENFNSDDLKQVNAFKEYYKNGLIEIETLIKGSGLIDLYSKCYENNSSYKYHPLQDYEKFTWGINTMGEIFIIIHNATIGSDNGDITMIKKFKRGWSLDFM